MWRVWRPHIQPSRLLPLRIDTTPFGLVDQCCPRSPPMTISALLLLLLDSAAVGGFNRDHVSEVLALDGVQHAVLSPKLLHARQPTRHQSNSNIISGRIGRSCSDAEEAV